jgi:hypothetical protein
MNLKELMKKKAVEAPLVVVQNAGGEIAMQVEQTTSKLESIHIQTPKRPVEEVPIVIERVPAPEVRNILIFFDVDLLLC